VSVTEPDGTRDSPLVTAAAGGVTALTLAVGFGLLALGESFFWVAFPVGFGGLLPLAVGLARWYESRADEPADGTDRALAALRERYARDEIDEATFEERVDALLRTEDAATAREDGARRARGRETGAEPDRQPERETERD
jgi:hypothetical protein